MAARRPREGLARGPSAAAPPTVDLLPRKPRDQAPGFTLLDPDGQPFSLKKALKERKVWPLIYFYPARRRPGVS